MQKFFIGLVQALLLITVAVLVVFFVNDGMRGIARIAASSIPEKPLPDITWDASDKGELWFASYTPYDLDVMFAGMDASDQTVSKGILVLPENASTSQPVPAMVILNGSGGIKPGREMAYAQWLSENGIAGFVVDYYASRGIEPEDRYMKKVISVTEFDILADAFSALRKLRTHPLIEDDAIGVMGFSYGGMAARFALDDRIRQSVLGDEPGFTLHVDYYGPCFQDLGTEIVAGKNLLTLRGTEDASNNLNDCRMRETQLAALGVEVEKHVFEGVGHSWENLEPRAMKEDAPYIDGCEFVYSMSGVPFLNGEPIIDVNEESDRYDRVVQRMKSGNILKDCVKQGYIVGRDENAKQRSDSILLDYLARKF